MWDTINKNDNLLYHIYLIYIFDTKSKKMELDLEDLSILRRKLERKSNNIVAKTQYSSIHTLLSVRIILIQIVMCDKYKHPGTLRNSEDSLYSLQLFDIYECIFDVIPSNNLQLFDMLVAVENKLDIIM
jgi:hypothetical protein